MEFADRSKPNSVRFVLLLHTLPESSARKTHWDLMIEDGDFLLTFAFASLPTHGPSAEGFAWPVTRLADHRRFYLDYEGPIASSAESQGASESQPVGHRGSVRRLASGWAVCHTDPDAATGAADGQEKPKGYCRLLSSELAAEFDYARCPVGGATVLHIKQWRWLLPESSAPKLST